MKQEKTIENSKLGLFVLAGLLFLVLTLYLIGKNKSFFGSTYAVTADFHNVNGLMPGNNVRFSGIDVGTVNRIDIVSDSVVRVTMLIGEEYQPYIKQNAVASIGTDGLMGNKLISIKPLAGTANSVEEGGQIQTRRVIETDDMLETLNTTNNNVAVITSNLKSITTKLNERNSLWSILSDTVMAEEFRKLVKDIRSAGVNTAGVTRDAAELVRKFKNGKGPAMSLFTDSVAAQKLTTSIAAIEKASNDLCEASRELAVSMKKVEQGKSPAGVIMTDSLSAVQLRQTIKNIEEGTEKFNENMEAMKHNFLFRGYFKDQEKEKRKKKK